MKASKYLKKNHKYFLSPPKDGSNFKELFKRLTAAGAGRHLDKDGFPSGPWTPELLAEAISKIDANRDGIDLRTVQLWFQDNEKGVSTDNIRWLARVFGCDDPAATSDWQMELSAAQSRLTAKRRERKRAESSKALESLNIAQAANFDDEIEPPADLALDNEATERQPGFSLARQSEALFSGRSPLDLPVLVFAGAVTLGFLAYIVDIHSIIYGPVGSPVKQVGFIWAPNWTILFLVVLPLYLVFLIELLAFWKSEGRSKFVKEGDEGWARSVEAFSHSYWAVFLICMPVAFLFQWIKMCLVPLLTGDLGNFAVEWARMAIVRPEVISVPEAVAFTGLAYLYMGVCFFLFFVGLILLCTLVHDLWEIGNSSKLHSNEDYQREVGEVGLKVMRGIFRCTVLGILIAICMKLQSVFMQTGGETIVSWLVGDLLSVVGAREAVSDGIHYSIPTHYSSLLIVLAPCAVFLYGSVRIRAVLVRSWSLDAVYGANGAGQSDGAGSRFYAPFGRMTAVVALLVVSYLLIGAVTGFSILLSVGVLLTIYSLFDPGFGRERTSELGDTQRVL